MAGAGFLVGLTGTWLSLYKLLLNTIKGTFLGHSGIKEDSCLSVCESLCFNLQPLARFTNCPAAHREQMGVVRLTIFVLTSLFCFLHLHDLRTGSLAPESLLGGGKSIAWLIITLASWSIGYFQRQRAPDPNKRNLS